MKPADSQPTIAPHTAGPPRCCFATTGPSTLIVPFPAAFTIANWSTVAHSQARERNSCQPSRSSARKFPPSMRSPAG